MIGDPVAGAEEIMTKNIGDLDRALRVIAGLSILGVGLYLKTWWGLIGVIPLISASIRWCPLYLPFGLNTLRKKIKPE